MLRLILAIWLAWAGGAAAQAVTVRSGDHDGFTRLVLTFPEPAAWDFGRTGDGYGFRTPNPDQGYDLSSVFDRIGRDRLSALWVDPQTRVLRLGLSCVCHAIATPFRPGIVIIDIVDGPAPAHSPYETALENAGSPLPRVTARAGQRPKPRPRDFRPMPEPEPATTWFTLDRPQPSLLPTLRPRPANPQIQTLQEDLTRSLARAIAAGAVTPAPHSAPGNRPGHGPRILPLPPPIPAPTPQLRLVDPSMPAEQVTASGVHCIPPEHLALASWATTAPPGFQIAEARGTLLGEFDRPDRDRVIGLARLYLHHGFGAEARGLLALWAPDDLDRPILDALGLLVDGGTSSPVFTGMDGCDGPAALWAVLSLPAPAPIPGTDISAVLRAFSDLPPDLRRHLGPGLADRFLSAGDADSARSIRDAIDRGSAPPAAAVQLLDARLALTEDRTPEAETRFEAVVASDSTLAPLAMAALVESQVHRGTRPDADLITALEAMAQEYRASAEEPPLRRALALALATTGSHLRAFHDFGAQEPEMLPTLWAVLADQGSAVAVAELAIGTPDPLMEGLPAPTRLAVARRLLDAGFPTAATGWLRPLRSDTADIMRAEAAIQDRDGRTALRVLASGSTPEAERLRAKALELLDDLNGAHQAWAAAGDTVLADRTLFRAQAWDDYAAVAEPEVRILLDRRQTAPSDTADDSARPLAEGRALLDTSAETRQRLRDLLAAHGIP